MASGDSRGQRPPRGNASPGRLSSQEAKEPLRACGTAALFSQN
jgi:hypothetical protein